MHHGTSSSTIHYIEASMPKMRGDWEILKHFLPYLWQYRARVFVALGLVVAAKLANLGVPILLKHLVDALGIQPGQAAALLAIPFGLLVGYGLLRLSTALFTELRELVFAKATQGVSRQIALEVFSHLHDLSLRFHLQRQTGGMTRDIERGTRAVNALVSFSLYNILPTLVELGLVLGYLAYAFDIWFSLIMAIALAFYIVFTVVVTEWRTVHRRRMNALDSQAHNKAVDSLLNFETVKYFNNETYEAQRYDADLACYQQAALRNQRSLSLLNTGQQAIIATALVLILWRATQGVIAGHLSVGDLVMINAFMIQVYIPLNFLGMVYRQVKQCITDLGNMFSLLDKEQEIANRTKASSTPFTLAPTVTFEQVSFAYEASRPILQGISFTIPAEKTVAVVGNSGAGKSTLARLLYRFYNVQTGHIRINGVEIRDLTQAALRKSIGIVPQDTVLFNDTIAYNIGYGCVGASQTQIETVARTAHIHDFIISTPKGYETVVGERGLKLSGGEKQRIAIARTLLKNPPILIFDEATSALDSSNEQAIQAELQNVAVGKTTLVIAHRLSTIVNAHEILVMTSGQIVERGAHQALLAQNGEYAKMWRLQQQHKHTEPDER